MFWDEKTIFMDHEFISPDGFVNAVATCRQRVIGCGANTVVNLLHQVQCGGTCKAVVPAEMPAEVYILNSFFIMKQNEFKTLVINLIKYLYDKHLIYIKKTFRLLLGCKLMIYHQPN